MLGTFVAGQFAGQWVPLALFFSVLALMSLAGVLGLSHLRNASARPAALSTSQGIA
ncbi:hypothetical protein D3C79_765320 [compost metagenome]